jgi:hypothetical protein
MTFKRVLTVALFVLLAIPWASAEASWRFGILVSGPVFYYRPYPYRVYIAPAPVYVAPAPVYVQPVPVYVQPGPVYTQVAPGYVAPAPVQPPPPQYAPSLPPQPVPVNN